MRKKEFCHSITQGEGNMRTELTKDALEFLIIKKFSLSAHWVVYEEKNGE